MTRAHDEERIVSEWGRRITYFKGFFGEVDAICGSSRIYRGVRVCLCCGKKVAT